METKDLRGLHRAALVALNAVVALNAFGGGWYDLAAVAVVARWHHARHAAFAAGLVLLGWIVVQLAIIG